MGSSTSKAARTASSTVRKYPSRIPSQSTTSRPTNAPPIRPPAEASPGPTVHPQMPASGSRDQSINLDASDPDLAFNARLSQLGPVQPSPTMSNSSTFNASNPQSRFQRPSFTSNPLSSGDGSFQPSASTPGQSIFPSASPAGNPAIVLLQARERLAKEAEDEFENLGRRGDGGRRFLDVITIRQVLRMRDEFGRGESEIEKQFGLRKGVVGSLGAKGLVTGAGA